MIPKKGVWSQTPFLGPNSVSDTISGIYGESAICHEWCLTPFPEFTLIHHQERALRIERMNTHEPKPWTPRAVLLVITFAIGLYWLLANLKTGVNALLSLIAVTMPLLQGMVIAYVLNLPMKAIERQLAKLATRRHPAKPRSLRALSLSLTLLLATGLIGAVLLIVIPQVVTSLTDLSAKLPDLISRAQATTSQFLASYPQLIDLFGSFNLTTTDLVSWAMALLKGNGAGWFSSTVNLVSAVFGWLVSFVISLIFAIYLLLGKERLQDQLLRLAGKTLPARIDRPLKHIFSLAHKIFSNFFAGQFIEALILGAIFLVILSIFSFPYALLIAVLIAFTALIPMAGAYIALAVGAFLILLINPWQALAFIIIFLVVQQIENNLIYPRVVGGSIGLPAIWVLAAVVIGGGLFGVVGMIIFIPLTSVVYTLLRDWVNSAKSPEKPLKEVAK